MAPKNSKKPSKAEKTVVKSPSTSNPEKKETTSSETAAAAAEDASSGPSSPEKATPLKHMDLRRTPCLACVGHLISWMPSDEGVMYCQEGTSSATCARCENAGIECLSTTGVLKKPATNLHTALSKTIRSTESIKYFQNSVRSKLKTEEVRSCEDNRDFIADELCEKMEPFFESLRRSSRLEGFQSAMDLALETVGNCNGTCHCLLRGCTMGSKAAIAVAQEEGGEETGLKGLNGKKAKAGKADGSGDGTPDLNTKSWEKIRASNDWEGQWDHKWYDGR